MKEIVGSKLFKEMPEESNSKKGQGEGKPGSYGEARAELGLFTW